MSFNSREKPCQEFYEVNLTFIKDVEKPPGEIPARSFMKLIYYL
jgi:hypothetical protein